MTSFWIVSFEARALFSAGTAASRLCALIYVREEAPLVSQTLNGALALIIAANLWPPLVITDGAAAESYQRPTQKKH